MFIPWSIVTLCGDDRSHVSDVFLSSCCTQRLQSELYLGLLYLFCVLAVGTQNHTLSQTRTFTAPARWLCVALDTCQEMSILRTIFICKYRIVLGFFKQSYFTVNFPCSPTQRCSCKCLYLPGFVLLESPGVRCFQT